MNIEDIKIYLPKFLSPDSERQLFSGLKDFPKNIDERLYTSILENEKIIFQGDGLKNLFVVNLPDPRISPAPSIILSNTCDIDEHNQRFFPSQIVYAPIINLEKYKNSLLNQSNKTCEQITSHIDSLRRQEITQIFYLPRLGSKLDESIVFLDRVNNMPNILVNRDDIKSNRIFTLSNYGSYLFLLKLSIHFTRIRDEVDRG